MNTRRSLPTLKLAVQMLALLMLAACTSAGSDSDTTSASETTSEPEAVAGGSAGTDGGMTAVVNAQVYTVDAEASWADAFAYDENGVIVAVGTEEEVLEEAGAEATVIDAEEAMVVPGFQDAHLHVPEAGLNLDVCYFPDALTLEEYEALAVECATEQADTDWVRAAGASLFDLRSTDESPLAALDRAVPDRPVLVLDNLGHAVWTNTLGLEAAGISPDSPDPQGGVLHRDAEGNLTGLLLEDAQQLVRNAAALDDETNYQALLVSMEELAASGVTTVSDAGGYWVQNHPAAWLRAEAEGTLTVRGMNTLYVYPDLPVEEQLAEFANRFSNESDWVRFDTAKVYIDGILDLGTALLLEPYDVPVDDNYPSGFSYFSDEQLDTYIGELHALGYRINFHVIGDAATRQALDLIEAIDDSPEAIADRRHRATHVYLVDDADLGRFAEIGMIADFQQSDDSVITDYHDYLAEFIDERAYGLIPTAAVLEQGATAILSSDWDAGPLPPLGTIERALTRDANAVPDLATALAMHTVDAAYALGHDDTTGSIEVGKFADFVMLDQNLFDLPSDGIDETSVVMTVVGGEIVYEAS